MNGMRPADIALLAIAGDVRLAPDGRRIAFSVTTVDGPANRYRTRIWLGPTDGSTRPRPVTAGQTSDSLPRWSPDGGSLAFVSDRGESATGVWILPVDTSGEPTLVCARPDSITEVVWAPDGGSLAFIGREPDPARRGPDGQELPLAGQPPRRITHLFSRLNGEDWVSDRPESLFVVPLDGSSPPRRLLDGDWPVGSPAWSPDGRTLAVAGARHADWDLDLCNDIWLVDVDGALPPVRVTDTSASWAALAWSPDGASIAYLETPAPTEEPRHIRLGVLDVAGRTRRRLAADTDRNLGPYGHTRAPVWDGDRLLFAVERDGAVHVCAVPAAGGTVTTVADGDRVVHTFDAAAGIVAVAATSPLRPADISVIDASGAERLLVSLAEDLVRTRTLVAPERFVTRHADGIEVECWAMPPGGARPGERYPTIVNIHGGPFTSYGWPFFDEFQLQVGAGFGVVYCNPRGSSGYSEAWGRAIRWPEAQPDPGSGWGGVDYDDVMACTEEACRRFDWIDGDRLGVQGGSYGGYLTSWIVGHSSRFVAACSERAVNNLLTLEFESDIAGTFRGYVGADHVRKPDLYVRQSPATYVHAMLTPMLLVHSEGDLRCPIGQAEELFVALRLLGRGPELVRFPGEDHDLSRHGSPRHRIQRVEIILEWFAQHLGTGPTRPA